MPQWRSTVVCWCSTDTLRHFSLRIKVTETVWNWAVPLADTGLSLTSVTFTSSHVEETSHLTVPDPPGEEDKESSPREWGQWESCARREAEALPTVINGPASGLSSNNMIPDTWLNSLPAWNRAALSLLLLRTVPSPYCPLDSAQDCLGGCQLP